MRAPGLRREVVRGSARRIIVLPPPEDGPFERAVFVLRPDAEPVSEAELLREAMAAAAPFSAGEARGPHGAGAAAPGPALDTVRRIRSGRGRSRRAGAVRKMNSVLILPPPSLC